MNKQNGYIPSSFLGIFCPRQNTSDEKRLQDEFVSIAKNQPNISIATKSFIIHLVNSKTAMVAMNHENDVTLLLHGEIYNTKDKPSQAEFLLRQFIKRGIDFSKDINGLFAVLLIDKRNDTVRVITDRTNSRKVFYSKYKGNYWLSTSLNLHPTSNVDIDPVGIACYLANGTVHNNRTLFDGIRVLERACVNELTVQGVSSLSYWTYEFLNSYAEADEEKLCDELAPLLVDSVRCRVRDNPKVFLSLSGGYDSRGILGILKSIGMPDVVCLSYASDEPKPGSDPYVACKVASWIGYKHRVVKGYKGNIVNVIRHNAEVGQGISNFCDESDAWLTMSKDFTKTYPSVLMAGDNCFGFDDGVKMYSVKDALVQHNQIVEFDALEWLSALLGEKKYGMLYDGLHEDIKEIVKRCPPFDDYHDLGSFCYLDQRVGNVLLPWRKYWPDRFLSVREPFFDNSILDFMMNVPVSMRWRRHLYRQTVMRMFPSLFKIPVANRSWSTIDWKEEFSSQHSAIESLILSQHSKLDKIIPPEIIIQLLRESKTREHSRFPPKKLLIEFARRLLRGTRIANKIRSRFSKIDRTTLLKRILVMRLVLSK